MDIYLRGGRVSQVMKNVKSALFTTPSAAELEGLFSRDVCYVDEKARMQLGYAPQFYVDAGFVSARSGLSITAKSIAQMHDDMRVDRMVTLHREAHENELAHTGKN